MAHAFWKGSLSFGLVEIPVSLRPAVESDELQFTLLDREDFAPIGYRRYNKNTGREVPWSQVVRGYEYEPDQYVVLTDEELRRANVRASETIEIQEFVEGGAIDSVFYDHPYYVEPLKRGSKSYALLREALERSGRVGIARVVLRTRQRIAALVVRESVLVLNILRYAYEIRSAKDLEVPAKTAVSARELALAERLIEDMTDRWNPSRSKDEYREDVMALIRRKIKAGQTHTIVEPEPGEEERRAPREIVDLMPLLKRSLASRGKERAPASRAKGTRGSYGRQAPETASLIHGARDVSAKAGLSP